MRIVIDLRRGETPEVIVNNLFSQTQLQSSFGINMVALVDGPAKDLESERTCCLALFVTAVKW
jgi:DNA gyrase subunit A